MAENKEKELSFEEAMKKLEKISERMASGEETLDKSIELYKEGVLLVAYCREKLDVAERTIKVVTDKINLITEDFKGE